MSASTNALQVPPGYEVAQFDLIDSTNSEARRQAEAGHPGNSWFMARRQSGGRGRRGRDWVSDEGNLFASLLLRPNCTTIKAGWLSLVAALAAADCASALLPDAAEVRLKWPNDVLVDGAKISGILLEAASADGGRVPWVIIGIGINVAHSPDNTSYASTSLREAGAPDLDPATVFQRLASDMDVWLRRWDKATGNEIGEAWLARAAHLGKVVRVSDEFGAMEGTVAGLSERGALMLRLADGTMREIPAGDVFPAGQRDA